jgi:hypothetical protein
MDPEPVERGPRRGPCPRQARKRKEEGGRRKEIEDEDAEE